jgi:bifunctional non-homologous end joining protein LigD
MLPSCAAEPFDSPAHIFEVCWDGVRSLAFIEGSRVRMQDRYGRDVTHRWPELAALATSVREGGLVLDGEIVCLDERARPDFRRLAPRLAVDEADEAQRLAQVSPVTFQAFDVLYRSGQSLMGWPLRRRKEMLRQVVRPTSVIAVPDFVTRDGIAFFEAARQHGLEGIVAKESESRYQPGVRSAAWLQVPVYRKDNFVIAGFTYGGRWDPHDRRRPSRDAFTSLLLGQFDTGGRLHYVGEVSGGFTADDADSLLFQLEELGAPNVPFADPPDIGRLAFWCRPELAASVRYAEWADSRLRFPVFEALRPDVPASSCIMRQ